MKALVFNTGTPNTLPFVHSLPAAGIEIVTQANYANAGGDFVARVAEEHRGKVDFACYIGAHRADRSQWVPLPDVLARANQAVPMVHLCSDAADPPWWPDLSEYHLRHCFAVQVSIDGAINSPIGQWTERGIVEVTPIDPNNFPNGGRPWILRDIDCGFSGGGGFRRAAIERLVRDYGMQWFPGEGHGDYRQLCEFYSRCRCVVNFAKTGSAVTMHVKGRVIEAAMAGALVLEEFGAPTREWFVPGQDFIEYDGVEDAGAIIARVKANPQSYVKLAASMRAKAIERHSAPAFWRRVLAAAGIK